VFAEVFTADPEHHPRGVFPTIKSGVSVLCSMSGAWVLATNLISQGGISYDQVRCFCSVFDERRVGVGNKFVFFCCQQLLHRIAQIFRLNLVCAGPVESLEVVLHDHEISVIACTL
jgi:heme A synthase